MNFLFFDCETTGVPIKYNASYTEVDNWPRVISLAWILTNLEGEIHHSAHHLIRPNGWVIPKDKFWIDNGFSTEKSLAEGVPIDPVIEKFMEAKMQTTFLVAHNLNFDHRIVWAEIIRSGRVPRSGLAKICTMMTTTSFCKLPKAKGYGYKWPKLEELYFSVFQKRFDGAHDALADVTACKDCFFELLKRGVIKLPELTPS